jgi:hypothetical protein
MGDAFDRAGKELQHFGQPEIVYELIAKNGERDPVRYWLLATGLAGLGFGSGKRAR